MSFFISKIKIRSSFIIFSGYIFLLFSSSCNQGERVEPIEAEHYKSISNVVSLTNQSSDSPLVSVVSLVTTDSSNNIYLVEPRTKKIHSFTNDLSYRWSAGGQGNGPGLFNSISALYVDGEQLYVYEKTSSSITTYSLDGVKLNDWTFGEAGHRINSIHQIKTGKYVATGWNEKSGTVLNVYDENFKNRILQFNTFETILKTGNPKLEKQVLRTFPGNAIPVNDSTIIYSSPAYNGQLDVYKFHSTRDWSKTGSIRGYSGKENPIKFHQSQDGNNDRSHLSGFDPDGGYFHTEFTSMSHGLYKVGDKQFAHLSTRLNENDKWDLVIEYFNSEDLRLVNYKLLKSAISSQQFQQVPLWMDKTGRIYMNENSDTPLRILEISK